ncbi:MAG TPA: hypothetical protein VLW49_03960 [Gaiellaceae bacterium]|nr:hypothetical protein [Gaiellaceae bacterium]
MYFDHHLPYLSARELRPDRRPLPRANEIRLRVKRATSPKES